MSALGGDSVAEERRLGSLAQDTSNAEGDGISQCLKGVGTFTIGDETNARKDDDLVRNSYKCR